MLYLDGVKYGDRQMTALGMLMSVSFITISRAKPLSKLSPVRPITSIFHPALFLSILGQVRKIEKPWFGRCVLRILPEDDATGGVVPCVRDCPPPASRNVALQCPAALLL